MDQKCGLSSLVIMMQSDNGVGFKVAGHYVQIETLSAGLTTNFLGKLPSGIPIVIFVRYLFECFLNFK